MARELSSRTQTRHHSLLPHIAPGSQHRATDRHWTLTCDGRFGSQCFSGRWSASATLPIFQRRPASDGREGHLLQHCIHPPFPPHNPPLPLRVNYVAYCAHDMHTRAGWCTEKRGGEGAGGRWLTDPLHLPFQPPRSSPVVPEAEGSPHLTDRAHACTTTCTTAAFSIPRRPARIVFEHSVDWTGQERRKEGIEGGGCNPPRS